VPLVQTGNGCRPHPCCCKILELFQRYRFAEQESLEDMAAVLVENSAAPRLHPSAITFNASASLMAMMACTMAASFVSVVMSLTKERSILICSSGKRLRYCSDE